MSAPGLHCGTQGLLGMWTFSCSMWDLVPWPEIEHGPPALGAWNLSHWTTREVLICTVSYNPLPNLIFQRNDDHPRISVQLSHSVMFDSLRSHGLQYASLPCPSPIPKACSNSCPLSQWCHPTILSSVVPFSSCLQSFPASGSFPMSQFFAVGILIPILQIKNRGTETWPLSGPLSVNRWWAGIFAQALFIHMLYISTCSFPPLLFLLRKCPLSKECNGLLLHLLYDTPREGANTLEGNHSTGNSKQVTWALLKASVIC